MKKGLLSLAVIAFFAVSTQAQDDKKAPAKTTFGVKAGVGFQNFAGKEANGDRLDMEMAIKWNIGFNAEIPVAKDFFFQPGVGVATKGAKKDYTVGSTNYKQTANLFYVDIPMNFVYKPAAGSGNWLLGFGPYLGFGVGGKIQTEGGTTQVDQDVEFRGTVKPSDPLTKAYFKRVDGGANVFVGYEWTNRFSVAVDSQLGLVDIAPEYEAIPNSKAKVKNVGFGLKFGYRFGK